MTIEVKTSGQLKAAIEGGANEILVTDPKMVDQIKAVSTIKKYGSAAVGIVVAAIPVVIATGGVGAGVFALVAPGASISGTVLLGLLIAVGGTIAISLFADWDYVELSPTTMKMTRKRD